MNVTAHAQRADGWWAVDVPEVPGLFTQVKRLDQVAEAVRDAAQMLGAEVDQVTLDVDLPSDDEALVARAVKDRARLRQAEQDAAAASRAAVARLREAGLPVRDVATLMGVSPQRVSVLAR